MVLMALDHVRDYFLFGAFVNDPLNLETTTPILFLTRFVTHFCAPVFIFLTGTSASLFGQNKSKKELSKFLLTRGLWLIFVEIVIMNFLWWFNPGFELIVLQVIWVIGLCMVLLSVLIHLPIQLLAGLSLIIIFGHNLLDGIIMQGYSLKSILWYIFHQQIFLPVENNRMVVIFYPLIPWIGVMALGYCFGFFYHKGFSQKLRKKYLLLFGIASVSLFLVIRLINVYGDIAPWSQQNNFIMTMLSFINVTKYPPSLLYILITIGPTFFVLYFLEDVKSKITDLLLVFGRVPFFYYLIHVLFIHAAALLTLVALGDDWTLMILNKDAFLTNKLADYGYSLWVVYAVWIGIVALLYPFCFRYMAYKLKHKEKWWLSYL